LNLFTGDGQIAGTILEIFIEGLVVKLIQHVQTDDLDCKSNEIAMIATRHKSEGWLA
jgi:hypothetical protein